MVIKGGYWITQVYIVYMGALPSINDYVAINDYHFSLVRSVTGKR